MNMKISSFESVMKTLFSIMGMAFFGFFAFNLDANCLKIINPEWSTILIRGCIIEAVIFGLVYFGLLVYSEYIKASA